jgi:hypothetical protein
VFYALRHLMPYAYGPPDRRLRPKPELAAMVGLEVFGLATFLFFSFDFLVGKRDTAFLIAPYKEILIVFCGSRWWHVRPPPIIFMRMTSLTAVGVVMSLFKVVMVIHAIRQKRAGKNQEDQQSIVGTSFKRINGQDRFEPD